MLDVLTDRSLGLAEQFGQLLLVQPKGFRLQHHVDAGGAVFALVDQELLGCSHRVTQTSSSRHAEIGRVHIEVKGCRFKWWKLHRAFLVP